MPGDYYQITPANITLTVLQGASYYRKWMLRYADTLLPFPFYENGIVRWTGRCMFRESYDAATNLISLTSNNGGVFFELDSVNNEVFYGLMITAGQTLALPAGKWVYDIEFERLSDGWTIRSQQGKVIISPEATK
jgi:hypothetical protein